MMKSSFLSLLCLAALSFPAIAKAEGPAVTIAVDPEASPLESYAADELSRLLTALFDAKVTLSPGNPPSGGNVIHLYESAPFKVSPPFMGTLDEQDFYIRSTPFGLVIHGGSPVATLWAIYEYGYANGMRYLTSGDFPPVEKPKFTLDGYDIVLKPRQEVRAWHIMARGPASQASWSLVDHEKLLRQLAKLRFNAVILPEPDLPIAFDPIDVTGDIAGRSVFGGAKAFANPDLSGGAGSPDAWFTGIRTAASRLGLATEPVGDSLSVLSLGEAKGGLLPQTAPVAVPKGDFAVEAAIVGDINPPLHFLSRAAWDESVTPESALAELAAPICGDGVAEPLALGFAAIAEATALIEKNDPTFAVPDSKMFLEHYQSADPAPEWWAKAKELYGKAMGEMYRANTRARDGARPWILYHAKRDTFALHYFTAVETARAAGIARAAEDEDAWAENLELSIEAMHNALAIYSEVAADPSDRGVIAILNEFGYRPLLEALDELP